MSLHCSDIFLNFVIESLPHVDKKLCSKCGTVLLGNGDAFPLFSHVVVSKSGETWPQSDLSIFLPLHSGSKRNLALLLRYYAIILDDDRGSRMRS